MNARRSATRAAHYRRMAMETYALAERTDEPPIIAAYMEIASRWLRMAEAAERDSAAARPAPSRKAR